MVRLSFGAGDFTERGSLAAVVTALLQEWEERVGIPARDIPAPLRLRRLLRELHRSRGQRAVLLIDEYDKPILDPLVAAARDGGGARRDTARRHRDFLRGFYAVIKEADEHLRFSLLTGVTRFSKVSLFSGLNNLKDITLDPRYSAICGYTDRDLDTVFAPELSGLDRDRIRGWYNGYSWDGAERLYNPFGVLMLFDTRRFGAHWFETGSPRFLLESLFRRRIASPRLDSLVSSEELLSVFDVEEISTEAPNFGTAATPTSTAAGENRSTWGRWSSAAPPATSRDSRSLTRDKRSRIAQTPVLPPMRPREKDGALAAVRALA